MLVSEEQPIIVFKKKKLHTSNSYVHRKFCTWGVKYVHKMAFCSVVIKG